MRPLASLSHRMGEGRGEGRASIPRRSFSQGGASGSVSLERINLPSFRVGRGGRPGSGWRALTGVLRGGSWENDNPDNLRAANRNNDHPGNRNQTLGIILKPAVDEPQRSQRSQKGELA